MCLVYDILSKNNCIHVYNLQFVALFKLDDDTRSDISVDGDGPKTNATQTFIHLLKGYIGPGCLSLPWAVSQVGFFWGTIAIAIMSFWSSYNCWTIVKIKRYIERSNLESQNQNVVEGTETRSVQSASSVASTCVWS